MRPGLLQVPVPPHSILAAGEKRARWEQKRSTAMANKEQSKDDGPGQDRVDQRPAARPRCAQRRQPARPWRWGGRQADGRRQREPRRRRHDASDFSIWIFRTQHPQPVIGGGGSIDPRMLHVLLINWLAFLCFAALVCWSRYRLEILQREVEEVQALEALHEPGRSR